jgi:hypothetical protein
MSDPGFEAYLVEVVSRTGVHRYRYLSLEQPDLVERARWQSWVIGQATGNHTGQRFDPVTPPVNQSCCGGTWYPDELSGSST